MKYDPDQHRRHSIRLKGYDYAQTGAYFVTLCTHNRECLFGEVVNDEMVLNDYGRIAKEEWSRSADIRREIELDAFMVMPNHMHGIVIIRDDDTVGAHGRAPLQRKPRSLGAFVAGFKSASTKRINAMRGTPGVPVWQRNYYEHIIRDDQSLERIRDYIMNNVSNWVLDRENPTIPPKGIPARGEKEF